MWAALADFNWWKSGIVPWRAGRGGSRLAALQGLCPAFVPGAPTAQSQGLGVATRWILIRIHEMSPQHSGITEAFRSLHWWCCVFPHQVWGFVLYQMLGEH